MNLLLTDSIYFVFSSLENQRRLSQIKVPYKFFSLQNLKTLPDQSLRLTNLQKKQLQKKKKKKKAFSSVYATGTTCFDKYVIFHVITDKAMLLLSWKEVI